MKRLSQVVLLSAFILSGYSSASFASYFFYLKNDGTTPVTQTTSVNLDNTGAGTLVVPKDSLGLTGGNPALTFTIPANSLQRSQVNMWKDGTNGEPECLDMGVRATGMSATSDSADPTTGYKLTLKVGATVNVEGCPDKSNPVPLREASISGPEGFIWDGTYYLYNRDSVPEPSSLALLGVGLSALLLAGRRKAKRI